MLDLGDRQPIKLGIIAGIIASLCCVGPLILIVLGIGSASTALAIGKQSPYFFTLGIMALIIGLGFHYHHRKKQACECEQDRPGWIKSAALIFLSGMIFLTVYFILIYLVVPRAAPIVYQYFYPTNPGL